MFVLFQCFVLFVCVCFVVFEFVFSSCVLFFVPFVCFVMFCVCVCVCVCVSVFCACSCLFVVS